MKNIILLVLLSVIFIACSIDTNIPLEDRIQNHTLYYSDSFKEIPNKGCIGRWLDIKIDYVADEKGNDTWNDPQVTLESGFGDCDDFVLCYMNISYMQYGEKTSLILVNNKDLYDTNYYNINHVMVVDADGYVVGAQLGMRHGRIEDIRPNGEHVYSFDEVFTY